MLAGILTRIVKLACCQRLAVTPLKVAVLAKHRQRSRNERCGCQDSEGFVKADPDDFAADRTLELNPKQPGHIARKLQSSILVQDSLVEADYSGNCIGDGSQNRANQGFGGEDGMGNESPVYR